VGERGRAELVVPELQVRNTAGTRMPVDQLRDFPCGAFDDGPDALELAVRRLEIMTNPR
jgi:hypothetical protein